MLLTLITAGALADPPDKTRALLAVTEGAGTDVERMVVGVDGDIVVGRVRGTLEGWLLDVDSWEIVTFGAAQGCEVTGVAPIRLEDGTDEVWMSCGDGSVRGKWWSGGKLVDVTGEEGEPIVFEGVDETLSGLWYHVPVDEDQPAMLYAISSKEDGTPSVVHAIDPFLLAVDAGSLLPSYPKPLLHEGFNEAVVTSDLLFVSHHGRNLSYLQLGTDAGGAVPPILTQASGCDDMFASPYEAAVYCVAAPEDDPTALGTAFVFRPITGLFTPLGLGELVNPNAIGLSRDPDDGWLAVTGTQVKVWELDAAGVVVSTEPYFEGEADSNPIQDMETSEGYLFGGGIGGNLHVVTARPWVYPKQLSATPLAAVDGDTIELKFTIDEASDWEVRVGGTRSGGGSVLADGTAAADVEQLVTLTVDDRWAEGDNGVFVIATNDVGLTGHGQATVDVDNPPDPPALNAESLQFGDESLVLSFDGIPDEDLKHYVVYVSEAPFVKADWPTGGPEFDGATRLNTPIQIPSEPGARVSHRIHPLENDVTYHVAVRAWDDGDKEGPMSQVLFGTPRKTYSASEYVGDPGGSPCSTGSRSVGWLGLLGVGALAARRRRVGRGAAASLAALAGLVFAGLVFAVPAQAQGRTADEDPWWRQDMTPSRGNFQIRYGVINLVDDRLEGFYTEGPANLLQAEFGPQLWRIGEIDLGFGFFQELSFQRVKGSLTPAPAERTMLTWFPLSLDATLRAHVLDEQPAVPFVRYGWDYVIWSEKWDNSAGTKDTTRGAKFGTHSAIGVDLLLDLLQPGRASFLEAQTGINDSWLTLEWRRQRVDSRKRPWSGRSAPGDRLDFSGDAFMVGLKLDW
jgi:MYXO-CTERM domain-containing protein